MLKIDSIMNALDDVDRKLVALEVYHSHFGPEVEPKLGSSSPEVEGKLGSSSGQVVPKLGSSSGEVQGKLTPTLGELHQEVVRSRSVVSKSNNASKLQQQEEKDLLQFLNAKTGRSFRCVEANLVLIRSRLKSGATSDDIRGVIARKVRQWKGTEMEKFLRPATLFNHTKFEQYLGEQQVEPRA